jgi:hypothetical protein|tara:strand:+ start:61 stop:600 length:540 start_codon:yes stop_codon:yes gene_type:complete
MKTDNIERYLESFGRNVVQESKKILGKAKGSTALANSIRFKVESDDTGFSTKFYMYDYGTYLDEGVSGNQKKQYFVDYKGKKRSSPYSYTTKGPPIDILSKWIKKKGIKPKGFGRGRSKNTGQYISAFAYLISRKIKRDGIKSLSFFQKPLGIGYDKLQNELLQILKVDIQTYLTTFTK